MTEKELRKYLNSENFPKQEYHVQEVPEFEQSLRTKSDHIDVEFIMSEKFQSFLSKLKDAMFRSKIEEGWMHAGISAVQVGEHIAVFYAYDGMHDKYRVYINPELEILGNSTDEKDEACLSIPKITGKVRRSKRIRIKYYDENGKRMREKLSGWNARVVQHEFDHVQGILFTDLIVD